MQVAVGKSACWRVLLLPYIDVDTNEAYARYNFSEEWNSAGNLAVMQSLQSEARVFSMDENGVANYLAIGDGDEWPSKKPLKARVLTSGRDHFVLFEYPDSNIRWAEPKY